MAGVNCEKSVGTEEVTQEINYLKELYKGRIRVTSLDEKASRFSITIQPKDMNITIKFVMSETYPSTSPKISVRSSDMEEEDIKLMEAEMTQAAKEVSSEHGLIHALMRYAQEWLTQHHFKLGGNRKHNGRLGVKKRQEKGEKRRERVNKQLQEETANEKKDSMKTADDVVKRILWDGKLESDQFVVGYIDRFLGIQEKYFIAFSWEDLATVDYTVLAIPKHRIQYFKYKDIVIWDKKKRLDNVFGSLGSNITVYDVVENYERMQEAARKINEEGNTNDSNEDGEDDDDSDDSDDGITVNIGSQSTTDALMNKAAGAEGVLSDEEEDNDVNNFDPFWRDKMRPNYFLALRITDEDVKKMAEHIQDVVLEKEPQFEPCCIPSHSLHITLCTLGLDTAEQVANAVAALKELNSELSEFFSKNKTLTFNGIDQFFNRVLYAKVESPQEFLDMVEHLKLCLKSRGIEIRDNHEFVPHMTIMKITRAVGRETDKKYIPPWSYTGKGAVEFGTQEINNIYLCEMGINRRDDGFYMSPVELHW